MTRLKNWTVNLNKVISSHTETPFQWGVFDCCVFASECCKAICGKDPYAEFRGRYSTKIGAFRIIKNTYGSLDAILDNHFQRIDLNFVQRGDICIYENEGEIGLAVFNNGWFSTAESGVRRINIVPLNVWRVE